MRGTCAGLVVALIVVPSIARSQDASPQCAAMTRFQISGVALEITRAQSVPTGPAPGRGGNPVSLPSHCRVDGMIDRRAGADGKGYGIGFAVALPDNWNGRFLFQGGGGLNGTVGLPLGAQAAGDTPALLRGFAVVTTDTGHQSGGGAFDGSFMRDQQASLDFAYVAVGRVAVLAKAIVAQYYGRPAAHSYFAGCSTGGREAMLMTQRYPTYFDGVVAGAPAMRTGYSGLGDRWAAIALNQIAPKDAAGKPIPGQVFSDGDKKLIVDTLLNVCDARDGVKDGMISDLRGCDFDPVASLTCKGAKTDACLTPLQTAAIKKAFSGPRDSRGNQIYPGFLYDTGITASGGGVPGLLSPGPGPLGPANLSTEIDVDKEAMTLARDPRAVGDTRWWTNLGTFAGRGGKLLFYHGASDPWFSALDTLEYYEKLGADNGGIDKVAGWSRLFLVPGMRHCNGGQATDTFDLLSAMVDWVEKGSAPDAVVATGRAFPGRSRPLCAYPNHSHYLGSGDSEDAKNFVCRP
jgi:feruloyl esterase